MVIRQLWLTVARSGPLLGQVAADPHPTARQVAMFKLVSALVLLTIGGVALVVLAWLALRVGRRQVARADETTRRASGPPTEDWARVPRAAVPEKRSHEPDG